MPDDLLGTTVSRSPRAGEELLEPGMTGRKKVAEQVQLAPGGLHAELAPRHDAQTERLARAGRFGNAAGRVVVGEGDRSQTRGLRAPRDVGGRIFPVRRRRMAMQVNARRRHPPARSKQAATAGTALPVPARRARPAPPRDCGYPPARSECSDARAPGPSPARTPPPT